MTEMIGTLDERTLHAEMQLTDLEPLARAYWSMAGYAVHPLQFAKRFGEQRGIVQVFYPGPIAKYEKVDGRFNVGIFLNGGSAQQAEELHRNMLAHARRGSGQ